jgi:cell division protein FtsL
MSQKNKAGDSLSFSGILKITLNKTIALIALAALLILGFWITYEIRKTANDLKLLQIEEGRLSAQYKDFSIQMSQIKARNRMEKLGREMGLHPPTDKQTISLN